MVPLIANCLGAPSTTRLAEAPEEERSTNHVVHTQIRLSGDIIVVRVEIAAWARRRSCSSRGPAGRGGSGLLRSSA